MEAEVFGLGGEAGKRAGAMQFTGGNVEVGAVRLAGGDEDVKDAREFAGQGGHGGSAAESGPQPAAGFAEFVLGVAEGLRGQAQRAGDAVGRGVGAKRKKGEP